VLRRNRGGQPREARLITAHGPAVMVGDLVACPDACDAPERAFCTGVTVGGAVSSWFAFVSPLLRVH
jgi:hypothetical protein